MFGEARDRWWEGQNVKAASRRSAAALSGMIHPFLTAPARPALPSVKRKDFRCFLSPRHDRRELETTSCALNR
jgi:hypothetical protein